MTLRWTHALVIVGATLAAAACGGSPPPEPTPPPTASAPPPARPTTPATNNDDAARRAAEEAARELARKRAVLEEMVFFDYDMSAIRDDARRTLDAKVQILRAEPGIRIRIEGHADERGSTEYNLALGSRRAGAIRDYLTGFGLSGDRFEIVSYGEARPLEQASTEAAWSRNRRGQFQITAGLAAR